MAETTHMVVTSSWQKVSSSDCTMQSNSAGVMYDIHVGIAQPVDIAIKLKLDEPKTFAYKSPVWLRLNAKGSASNVHTITIIK